MKGFLHLYVFETDEPVRSRRKALQENLLQEVLRREAGVDAPIRLEKEARGKPYCADFPDLHFNMSDSGPYTMIAVSDRRVGADVEQIPPRPAPALEQRRFIPPEKPPPPLFAEQETPADFIYLWTCKESLLKYIGCGLGAEMKQHPVLWHTDPISGKPTPYALFGGEELAFSSFWMQQAGYILTLCHPKSLCGKITLTAGFPEITCLFPTGTGR
ncbi:MAG: 4'-phosphopantetheinyl transferase superfamily protein [Bacteroidales bacterium]|nr:4'-phosphopantetheinyl transferase superfamily protein [Bacteroidales bacterium]